MKIFFISLLTFILCIFLTIKFVAVPKATSKVEDILIHYGFQNADIKDVQFNFDGFTIPKIILDDEGFNVIENLKVGLFWPTYLITSEIENIKFKKIKISSTTKEIINNFNLLKRKFLRFDAFPSLDLISAPQIIWDISTRYGAIRINAALDFKDNSDLLLDINAAQHQLAFDSQWNAKIIDQNHIDLQGTFTNMKLNMPPFTLNRADGWVSYNDKNGISGQLNAGSGTFLTLPLQSINIAASTKENYYPVIIRSQITGNPTSNIYADINLSNNIEYQDFNFRFVSTNYQNLLKYLNQRNIVSADLVKQNNLERFLFTADFLKERRFVDGPWPFSIMASDQIYKDVNGVMLFYPDTQTLRGSAQGNKDIVSFLKFLFSKSEETGDEVIRFDDDMKKYLIPVK